MCGGGGGKVRRGDAGGNVVICGQDVEKEEKPYLNANTIPGMLISN